MRWCNCGWLNKPSVYLYNYDKKNTQEDNGTPR